MERALLSIPLNGARVRASLVTQPKKRTAPFRVRAPQCLNEVSAGQSPADTPRKSWQARSISNRGNNPPDKPARPAHGSSTPGTDATTQQVGTTQTKNHSSELASFCSIASRCAFTCGSVMRSVCTRRTALITVV